MEYMLETSAQDLSTIDAQAIIKSKLITLIGSSCAIDNVRQQIGSLDLEPYSNLLKDIGNVQPSSIDEWSKYLGEYIESQIDLPIIVSDKKHFDQIKKAAYSSNWSTAFVSNRVVLEPQESGELNHDIHIGVQNHFKDQASQLAPGQIIRLKDIRDNHEKVEAAIRTIDIAFIDLNAIRIGDNLGYNDSSSAGLTIEEMCQISKYIGASINLKAVIIGGYDQNRDKYSIVAKNISLIFWYLLAGIRIGLKEGAYKNKADYNTYTIVPDNLECEIIFKENISSGRWWIEMDNDDEVILVPCTKDDYESACINQISDSLMQLFTKI